MKKLLLILIFIIPFCACANRHVVKSVDTTKTKITREVDKNMKIINPIQPIEKKIDINDTLKIVTKDYISKSYVEFETGRLVNKLEPARDSIPIKIKEKQVIESENTIENRTKTVEVTPLYIKLFLFCLVFIVVSYVVKRYKPQ